jgi:hypothetical protein
MPTTNQFDKTAFIMGSHESANEHQYEQWRSKNASELFEEVQLLIATFFDDKPELDTTIFSMRKHNN